MQLPLGGTILMDHAINPGLEVSLPYIAIALAFLATVAVVEWLIGRG